MIKKIIIYLVLCLLIVGCGKVGPLALPKNKVDKSIIVYPCDKSCMKKFEDEKLRQQSVIIQSN